MWCRRFTVLFFASILTGLLAASLAPWSTSAVTSCLEPAEVTLSEAGGSTAFDGEAAIAVDAVSNTSWKLCAPGASRAIATPPTPSRAHRDPLGAHIGRAPPLA